MGTWWPSQQGSPAVLQPHTRPGRCGCGLSGSHPPSLSHKSVFQWRRAMRAPEEVKKEQNGLRSSSEGSSGKVQHQFYGWKKYQQSSSACFVKEDLETLSVSTCVFLTYYDNLSHHRALKQRTRTQSCHGHVIAAESCAQHHQPTKKHQRPENKVGFGSVSLFLHWHIEGLSYFYHPRGCVVTIYDSDSDNMSLKHTLNFHLFWRNIAMVHATGLATDDRAADRW